MSDDFDPASLHPEDIPLDPDFTSEMSNLRPLVHDDTDGLEVVPADQALDLDAVVTERDAYKDLAQRLQADFDNYRKRMASQQALDVQAATGRLAEALLPVLDACEAAFVQHPAEVEPLFNLHGQPFDPNLAEAVLHEDGDDTTADGPVVVEVLRSGYTWKGKVLRAAMVKVKG
jgi:molecular chaperone GrpE